MSEDWANNELAETSEAMEMMPAFLVFVMFMVWFVAAAKNACFEELGNTKYRVGVKSEKPSSPASKCQLSLGTQGG